MMIYLRDKTISETDANLDDAELRSQDLSQMPLVIDLDDTFLKIDTLYELFVRATFTAPINSS